MPNLIALIDAVCDTYDDVHLLPKDGVTFCNIACNQIAVKMGCKDLVAKTADDIYEFMIASSQWSEVAMEKAQDLANNGALIFAVASGSMLNQDHGHICVIRPGLVKTSGKWIKAPCVMNIGAQCFIGRAKSGPLIGMPVGLNEAFVPMPRLFVWRPSL